MTSFIAHTAVDSHDAFGLSLWWAEVLGYVEDPADPNRPGDPECLIRDPGSGHEVLFIEVADAKVAKNRLHFDLRPRAGTLATRSSRDCWPTAPPRCPTTEASTAPVRAGSSWRTPKETSSASCAVLRNWRADQGSSPHHCRPAARDRFPGEACETRSMMRASRGGRAGPPGC